MKNKEIIVGGRYKLARMKYSNPALSKKYFKKLLGSDVVTLEKYSDFRSKNTIRIAGMLDNNMIEMWCSPYDLESINDK